MGKGFAKEATQKIIDFCFNELEIRKLTLGVVADNFAAVKLYKKLNFKTEGIYKKHGLYQGKYCDIIRMALFNPNFEYDD
jgi:RimJ/RimL family protein N-acetyltransferase